MTTYAVARPRHYVHSAYALRNLSPATAQPIARESRAHTERRPARLYAIQSPLGRARRAGLMVVAAVLIALFAPQAFAGDEPGAVASFDTYTVAQGESLWSIASALTRPGEDVQDTVAQIQMLNAMNTSTLRAGDQLVIPGLDR